MKKFNVTMEYMMIDWYESNRHVLDYGNYYLDVTSLALDYPIEFRDGMGFIIEGKDFEDCHRRRRDKLFLNMNKFATTVLNLCSFIMQDYEAYNHLQDYSELMNDPVIRRFFLSYISVATREIQETLPVVDREKLVRTQCEELTATGLHLRPLGNNTWLGSSLSTTYSLLTLTNFVMMQIYQFTTVKI